MLTLRESVFSSLQELADKRGVSVQGLIRAVIVPEWHLEHTAIIEKAASQNFGFNPDELAKETVSIPAWPKNRKTVEENISTKIVA